MQIRFLNRPRLRSSIRVGAAALALAMCGAALAAKATSSASTRLSIAGTGKVIVSGGFVALGQIKGSATLVIQDDIGGAKVTVGKKLRTLAKGATQIDAVSGRVYVEGKSLVVTMIAPTRVDLSLSGSFTKLAFEGSGSYQLNGAKGSWVIGSVPLTTAAPALQKRGSPAPKPPTTSSTSSSSSTSSTSTTPSTSSTSATSSSTQAGSTKSGSTESRPSGDLTK